VRKRDTDDHELFDAHYQNLLFPMDPKNPLMAELRVIDSLLDEAPEILDLVHADLCKAEGAGAGRPAEATSEQVLRSAILKQLRDLDYRNLAQEIDANPLYRKFTRFYGKKIPHFTRLNDLIKMIAPETMLRINEAIVRLGIKKKVENGKSIRHDTTVAETDIAWPRDSRLLNDSVRVLTRLLKELRQAAPELEFPFHDRGRAAKKRAYQIAMGKGKNAAGRREVLYQELLNLQAEVCDYARQALGAANAGSATAWAPEVMSLIYQLTHYLTLADRVWDQAHRRVVLGEMVPAAEKIVSIFEEHTDIICRGKTDSPTEFGHKFDVATGRSGLIVRYEVLEGNPGDGEILERAIQDHIKLFGRAPKRLTADRRYHSAENERIARELGVDQVALPKPGRLSEIRRELQKAPWFRRLMRFRAGIEGNLSTLLRSFGLSRCLWKGWRSFQAYIGLGVLTYNLRLLAGHLLKT
jgi:IS5 family transposase